MRKTVTVLHVLNSITLLRRKRECGDVSNSITLLREQCDVSEGRNTTMSKTSNNYTAPVFSLEQISFLEREFPECWIENYTEQQRCFNAGQRSVLARIRQVSGVRYVPEYNTK